MAAQAARNDAAVPTTATAPAAADDAAMATAAGSAATASRSRKTDEIAAIKIKADLPAKAPSATDAAASSLTGEKEDGGISTKVEG